MDCTRCGTGRQDACILNDALKLMIPEGFHVMTEEERGRVRLLTDGEWVGLSNPERHILVTVGWKPVGRFAAAMLSGSELAGTMEKKIRKPMQGLGYRLEGFTERTIAGTKANGFRYGYEAQTIEMTAESCAVKHERTIYYFHFYARAALKQESLPVWEELLDSACWK